MDDNNFSIQMDPTYRPSLVKCDSFGAGILPFAGSDLVISPSQWSSHVVGIDLFVNPFVLLTDILNSSIF